MVKLRWIRKWKKRNPGDISNVAEKSALNFISQGYAEYVIKDNLNWDQKKAIELEVKGKLPELAKFLKEEGRQKQSEKVVKEMIEIDVKDEKLLRKLKEEKELDNKREIQRKFVQNNKTEENELYLLKMEIISLLALKKRRQATEEIVDYIGSKHNIYTTMDDVKSEMWRYENGVYKQNGKSHINQQCRDILGEHHTSHLTNEVINKN